MNLLSLREQKESSYLKLERDRAYVTGTSDQWMDGAEAVREHLFRSSDSAKHINHYVPPLDDCYPNGNTCFCKRFEDNPAFRDEFNRKFNRVIQYHNQLHRDATPQERTDRGYYPYRYYRLFEDLMFLLEEYPDACSEQVYRSVVNARKHYRDLWDKSLYAGNWRIWPTFHKRR